jgi:hypothetical protein
LFGDSLLGLRLLPAVAGAATVWLTGKLAREMGGGRYAQALAALAVVVAPVTLAAHHLMTMNAFEPLIWMGCAWCVVRAAVSGRPVYWLWFGILVGVGLENKYTVAFFAVGVVAGLLATPHRRFLKSRWIWLGAAAALAIFLPNLIWLVRHDFPFLELMANVRRSGRDVVRGPVAFVLDQAVLMNPASFPLWVGGVAWLFLGPAGRRLRVLGWAYVVLLALMIWLGGKNYYVTPAYPMLFAAGAAGFEALTRVRWRWSRGVYAALLTATGVALAPFAVPVLPPEDYVRYQQALGFEPPKFENQRTGPLPQLFADEFGWEEMTREVARVYHSLPPEERARTAIFANSFGQAGAIDFFGPRYGLPKAVSGHQNYWYWGPRDYTGEIVIVLGSDGTGDREHFRTVEAAGQVSHPYSRRDEYYTIWLCRELTPDFRTFWPDTKKWN